MNKVYRQGELGAYILKQSRVSGAKSVEHLWLHIHSKNPEVSLDDFRSQFLELVKQGLVRTNERQPGTFAQYLRSWRFAPRFWAFLVATLLALFIVEIVNADFPAVILRWVAGTFLVLFAPGFALTWSLFPERTHPSGVNRFTLTVVLSLFLTPAIALLLNYTPIGLEARPIAIVMTGLVFVLLFSGAYREFLVSRLRVR